jgi:CheY-like chemotaxis protein
MVRDEAREKQLDVALDLVADHYYLNGDPARLQQVFWNLLRNAVKFTPFGGHIRVWSHNVSGEGDVTSRCLCIEVRDDGVGFAPSVGSRIFEPFERGDMANDRAFPGLGLGLAIARAIVDLHGGEIRGHSPGAGHGATFTVELPLAQQSDGETALGAEKSSPPVLDVEPEPPMRLLVVEDHQPTLQVLTRLLTRAGHHITAAGSIAAARAAAAQETLDAVISDVGLPDGTGIELMRELHAAYGLRGIALSGYGTEEDVLRSTQVGFIAHLVKPVDVQELRRTLRRLIRVQR